jgi:outer membrane protein OmpA-like peptidoglycan-associated protein
MRGIDQILQRITWNGAVPMSDAWLVLRGSIIMNRVLWSVVLGLGVVWLSGSGASAAQGGFCSDPSVDRAVVAAAHDELDFDGLQRLSSRFDSSSEPDPGCGKTVAFCVGRKFALRYLERAYDAWGANPPDPARAKALMLEGQKYGAPWQLLDALGQVDGALARETHDAKLYMEAAHALQFALNGIDERPLCEALGERLPDPEDIARIRKRAAEAVMLSPHFDVARTKQGDCGGIFLDRVRGMAVESVPVPITFPKDQAEFTAEGQKAAEALLRCLQEKKFNAVILTGHTDLQGPDQYNMELSARRLVTVAKFLKEGGYSGSMRLIPRGKREPFKPDDPTQHTPEEIDQMNRRVELRETAQ